MGVGRQYFNGIRRYNFYKCYVLYSATRENSSRLEGNCFSVQNLVQPFCTVCIRHDAIVCNSKKKEWIGQNSEGNYKEILRTDPWVPVCQSRCLILRDIL